MRTTKKTIIIISVLFFFSFFFFSFDGVFAEKEGRSLEVIYPGITDTMVPDETDFGLNAYLYYIFQLVLVLIGVAFFGVLLYNAIKYMLSAGDSTKRKESSAGIKAAFLGVTIFLLSWVILSTIHGEDFLTIDIKKPEEIDPSRLAPGAYVCNFRLIDAASVMASQSRELLVQEIAAAREDNPDSFCVRLERRINETFPGSGHNSFSFFPIGTDSHDYGFLFFAEEDGLKRAEKKPGTPCNLHTDHGTVSISAESVYPITMSEDEQHVNLFEGYSFNEDVPANYSFFAAQNEDPYDGWMQLVSPYYIYPISDFSGSFYCREAGWPVSEYTCGIRSMEFLTDSVFAIFREGGNCIIVESDKAYLDEALPTKRYGWAGKEERGFSTAIYFDTMTLVRGLIR